MTPAFLESISGVMIPAFPTPVTTRFALFNIDLSLVLRSRCNSFALRISHTDTTPEIQQIFTRLATIEQQQNDAKDNFIGERVATPIDIQDTHLDMREGGWVEGNCGGSQSGRFRGLPGGYRTFVKGLYMCSSGVAGGPAIGRGSSYNCYLLIAEDFGLPSPQY